MLDPFYMELCRKSLRKQLEASGTGKTDSGGRRRGNVRGGEGKEKGEKEQAVSGQPGGLRAILRLLSEAHLLAGSLSRGGCGAQQ